MKASLLKRAIVDLPDDMEVRIALDTWADSEDPGNREVLRSTRPVHFLEIRSRQNYAFLFLVHSEPEESSEEARSL